MVKIDWFILERNRHWPEYTIRQY